MRRSSLFGAWVSGPVRGGVVLAENDDTDAEKPTSAMADTVRVGLESIDPTHLGSSGATRNSVDGWGVDPAFRLQLSA